jgi:acyl-CoA thioester hydrolase
MKDDPARRELGNYPVRLELVSRFGDTDQQKHVNNVAVAAYYQEGRTELNRDVERTGYRRPAGSRSLVARLEIDYFGEIPYPGTVTIGIGISRIGTTSYTLGMAMFQQGQCMGLAATVLVYADAQGPAPLPAPFRALLEERMLKGIARP